MNRKRSFDLAAVLDRKVSLAWFIAGLTQDDLRALTNDMVDAMLDLIVDCEDEDVIFVPEDPDVYDIYATDRAETNMAWMLGHVIVHTTASAEESAFLAAELARSVENHGRSRYEAPWAQ